MSRLLVMLAVAAALMGSGQMARAEVDRVRVAMQPGLVFLPFALMRAQSLIEKHAATLGLPGLKTDWVDFSSGGASNDALLSGNVDVVNSGASNFLIVWDKTRGRVQAMAAVAGIPMLLLTRDPEIRSIKDFKPTNRIAVPTLRLSTQHLVLQMALEREFGEGAHSRYDNYVVQLGHPDAVLSLTNPRGSIDSHFSAPPYQQQQIRQHGLRPVLSSVDVLGGSITNLAYTTVKFSEDNPKATAAVIAALNEAHALIRSAPETAAKIYLEQSGEKQTVEDVVAMLREPGMVFQIEPANTQRLAAFMHKTGLISKAPSSWRDFFLTKTTIGSGN